jgi:hypothetical protein
MKINRKKNVLFKYFILLFLLGLSACGGGNNSEEGDSTDENADGSLPELQMDSTYGNPEGNGWRLIMPPSSGSDTTGFSQFEAFDAIRLADGKLLVTG